MSKRYKPTSDEPESRASHLFNLRVRITNQDAIAKLEEGASIVKDCSMEYDDPRLALANELFTESFKDLFDN